MAQVFNVRDTLSNLLCALPPSPPPITMRTPVAAVVTQERPPGYTTAATDVRIARSTLVVYTCVTPLPTPFAQFM